MSDKALNNQAVRALFDINLRIGELVGWVECGPYLMTDEDRAVDVGAHIIRSLQETRTLALQHMAQLAEAAGVPSPAVLAALEASYQSGPRSTLEDRP
jgi:hypothetical protein